MSAQAKDWLTDLQNERNDREEVNIRLPLKQLWVVHDIGWSPVYMGGKLYTLEGEHGWFSSKLYVNEIDQASGKVKSKNLAGKVKDYKYTRMIGYEGNVFISIIKADEDFRKQLFYLTILAYDVRKNKPIWKWESGALSVYPVPNSQSMGAWLTAANGKVILANMLVEKAPKVFCFDAATGRELWKSMVPTGYINDTYLPIAEGKVFVHTFNDNKDEGGHLAALDLATGRVLWDREFKEVDEEKLKQYKVMDYRVWQADLDNSAVYNNGVLYVPLSLAESNLEIRAFNVADGKPLWSTGMVFGATGVCAPLADAGGIYASVYKRDVVKVDRNTGKILWQKKLENYNAVHLQSPDWLCYSQMAPLTKTLEFVSKADGKPLASYKIENITYKRMLDYVKRVIAMDNRILVENEDETYYLFEGAK
jgi:outer membrane protein assembly factor BamB